MLVVISLMYFNPSYIYALDHVIHFLCSGRPLVQIPAGLRLYYVIAVSPFSWISARGWSVTTDSSYLLVVCLTLNAWSFNSPAVYMQTVHKALVGAFWSTSKFSVHTLLCRAFSTALREYRQTSVRYCTLFFRQVHLTYTKITLKLCRTEWRTYIASSMRRTM